MCRVLHDFYIPVCKELLKNVASAMGHSSRFIIADKIIPEQVEMGTEVTPYWMDFNRKLGPRMPLLLLTTIVIPMAPNSYNCSSIASPESS